MEGRHLDGILALGLGANLLDIGLCYTKAEVGRAIVHVCVETRLASIEIVLEYWVDDAVGRSSAHVALLILILDGRDEVAESKGDVEYERVDCNRRCKVVVESEAIFACEPGDEVPTCAEERESGLEH